MTEPVRLADQIRRAFEREAWHGDSVLELLKDVDAVTAATHPIPNAHSIGISCCTLRRGMMPFGAGQVAPQ